MLVAEMSNTTIELLSVFVEPARNEKIGIINDIAAAATSISIPAWAVVLVIEAIRVLRLAS